jgi:hypothetical protein
VEYLKYSSAVNRIFWQKKQKRHRQTEKKTQRQTDRQKQSPDELHHDGLEKRLTDKQIDINNHLMSFGSVSEILSGG